MTQPTSGWYPDPADSARQRFWAGDAWTAETRPVDAPPAAEDYVDPYAQYAASAASPAEGYYGYPGQGAATMYPVAMLNQGPTTVDGVPLAGWWSRVLASILDSLILAVLNLVIIPFVPNLIGGLRHLLDDMMGAMLEGSSPIPNIYDPIYGLSRAFTIYYIFSMVLVTIYVFAMLKLVGATLGQLACGLRVVPVDHGQHRGGLPNGPILIRILIYSLLANLVSLIGVGLGVSSLPAFSTFSSLVSLFTLLNVLWALWDPKRQCLHDKLASTQVIRTRL